MPVNRGYDLKGHFYQWGSKGKRYYYVMGQADSMKQAYNKAMRQGKAIIYHTK